MILELKVPFLQASDLDSAATELLQKYAKWRGSPPRPPIDVDEIVEGYLGLDLEVIDLEKQLGIPDVLGATWFDEKVVRVDKTLEGKEGRFTFTIAHEIGHWELHRPILEMERITLPLFAYKPGGPEKPAIVCRSGQQKIRPEWQANQFAARILMPAADVQAAMEMLYGKEIPSWEGLRKRFETNEIDEKLRSIATAVIEKGNFTNVSNEAMRRRLFDLKLVMDKSEASGRLF